MTFWDILVEEPFIAIREIHSVVFRKILMRTTFSGFIGDALVGDTLQKLIGYIQVRETPQSQSVTSWSMILLKCN